MKKSFILFLILISCQEKQQEKSILNECLSVKQVNLLNEMVSSFENDVCKYYNYPKDKSDKAIKEYLNASRDFKDASILLKIASDKSKKLLKESFTILSDDVWTTYSEENRGETIYILGEGDSPEKMKQEDKDFLDKYGDKYLVRKNGKLIDCLYKKASSKAVKKLFKLVMIAGEINPIIYIDNALVLKDKDFNSIKIFIALELFYSPLDFNLK
ncbi:MAG TPA: hypothetical protein ENK46_14240 [Flavobacteriia bacterium]|nr:hypothetical protein [Flavobacteriia bacterium]